LQSITRGRYCKFNGTTIKSGDTVRLRTGYHGIFDMKSGVIAGEPNDASPPRVTKNTDYITIEADTGAVPDVNFVWLYHCEYWHFKGLRISPVFSNQVSKSGKSDTGGYIINNSSSNHIIIEDCNIFGASDAVWAGWDANDRKDIAYSGIYHPYMSYCTLHGNFIHNVSTGIVAGGSTSSPPSYNVIEENIIRNFSNDGIKTCPAHSIIQDNIITDVYQEIWYFKSDGSPEYQHHDGIQFTELLPYSALAINDVIIRRNYVCARTDPTRTWTNEAMQGFFLDGLADGVIENNVILTAGNTSNGLQVNSYASNVRIVNNTVLRCYGVATGSPKIYVTYNSAKWGARNVIVRNNIAYNFPYDSNTVPSPHSLYENVDVDHNFNISSYSPFVEFVDYVHGNVHLAANSSFLNAGSSLDAPNEDLARNSRPQGQGYDVGAYEYVTTDSNNRAPVLQDIGNKSVNENTLLTLTVSATDPDGDTVAYSASGLPTGASFSGQTFSWTPGYSQAGNYEVTFIASDGKAQDSETVTITVNNVNQPPVLASIGNKSVSENSAMSFSVSATDPDGDAITYSVEGLPSGAVFASQSFSWTPSYQQANTYQVTFIASDGKSQDSETVTITVNNVNQPPVLAAISNKSVHVKNLLTFPVSATDPDGDSITYLVEGLPSGAIFAGQTFSWTPSDQQANTYQVTFIASDGKSQDSETVTITVNNVNQPPVLAAIGNKSVSENSALSFSVSATDPDGDAITYSADGLPSGAVFASQSFNWTPTYAQAGTYQVTFIASDAQSQDSETITITVNNVNRPPVLSSIGNKSVYVNDTLSFSVSAADPDGDTVEYSANGLPSGATFAGQSFNWQPDSAQVGSHQVTFTASDGQLQDSETITITVLSTDTSPPVVANCSPGADSIQVPLNTLVVLHIADTGEGADANSVIIKVDGNIIYSGNTLNYSSARGNCRRLGTKADYTYVYQSNEMFDFDREVTVTVNAADLAGNVMSQRSYSFTTEMQSFGQNKKVGSGSDTLSKAAPAGQKKKVSSGSDTLSKAAPATVWDSAGNIWAAWHAGPAGSRDIYVGKLAAGADNFGSSIQLTQSTADQCNPAIAIGRDDKLYVVWQDNRSGTWDIFLSTSTDGVTWSSERKISDSNNNEINPAIAIDTLNRAYTVWQDDRNVNQDIYIAASSNGFVTETVSQITSNIANQIEPAVAVDSSNTVYVVWPDARNGSSDIYGAASNKGPWTNVPIVNSAGNQSSPAIAVESEGSILHLLWVDDRSGNQDIYYATSNGLPSSPLSGSSIIDDTSGASQLAPAIVTNGSSKVFACWQDRRNVTANGGDTDLYFAELTSGSRTNVLVGDDGTNSNQGEPAIGIGEYGHPYLVWTDGRSANTEIYYAGSTFVDPVAMKARDVSASLGATVGTDPAIISSVDDVSVVVPPGACLCDIKITISKIKNPEAFATQCLGSYDFGPSGMELSLPATVTIPYTVSSSGKSASAYWYNSLTGALSQQGITNIENLKISSTLYALRFTTTHFTPFYLLLAGGDAADSSSSSSSGSGGGGGGGGGGCSISAGGEANFLEFTVPYIGLSIVMVILKLRDRRNQKTRSNTESKCTTHPVT
jgi:PKD repeat protein